MADQRMSTRQARWAVGDWVLVIAPHGVILLSPDVPGALDEDLWEQIHTDGVSLASVLDTLVMGAGGRLARIPDFGLVILGRDRIHLALRGGVVAEVDGARIDAEGVGTWYEGRLASAESLALYAPGAADSAQARLHPVRDAVLPASAVHLSVAPSEAESVISSASADSAEERNRTRASVAAQRTADYRSGVYAMAGGVVDPLPEDAPAFVKDYYDYYKTPRGYHPRSLNSNAGWTVIGGSSLINATLLGCIEEIGSAVMIVHGEAAHSYYMGRDAFARLTGDNKELVTIPGAVHTDLYDGGGKNAIPWDRLTGFFDTRLA